MSVILDGCCGAGGLAHGLAQAGHEVHGVDINPALREDYLRSGAASFTCADILEVLASPMVRGVDAIVVAPPCFPAGTPVTTARGVLPIETVEVGDHVLTHLGRWRPVTATMNRTAPVYADGWLAATADHPFWARDQIPGWGYRGRVKWSLTEPQWRPASDLHGRFVAIPAAAEPLPIPAVEGRPVEMGPTLWWMAGRWVGDGWVRFRKRGSEVHICCAAEEAEGLDSKLADTGLHWRRSQQRTTVRFTASHKGLAEWLAASFGQGAAGKTIPGWLLGADAESRWSFLDGYIAADGHTIASGDAVGTVSPGLAFGIRQLATTLGYTSSVTHYEPPAATVIEGRSVRQRPWWKVSITRDDGRYTRLDDLHRWVKRRHAMAYRGSERVYDLTVEEDHSFIAWGFAVHNCQHYSQMSRCRPGLAARYPELITPVRERLNAIGLPWVIENVEAARPWMKDPVTLCGWMFGREMYRHRLLEAGGGLVLGCSPRPPDGAPGRRRSCGWPHPVPAARAGHWVPGRFVSVSGHERKDPVRRVMEISWMRNRDDVAEAFPPYMAAWLGEQL